MGNAFDGGGDLELPRRWWRALEANADGALADFEIRARKLYFSGGQLLASPFAALALAGFLLIGLGAANIVPVLFRRAGAQQVMPAALAIAAITTTGYAGILVGPAGVGFVAKSLGLETAFWMLLGLLCVVPCCAALVTAAPERGMR